MYVGACGYLCVCVCVCVVACVLILMWCPHQLGLLETDYYDGKGEEGEALGNEYDWNADEYKCSCEAECTCDEDVRLEMEWLEAAMTRLEADVVAAEARCKRWAAARGVPDDAVKDIYSYLLEDMANE